MERTYQIIIGTETTDENCALLTAGAELHSLNGSLDRRKFEASVMEAVTHGGSGQQVGVSIDVMYEASSEDYLDTIERRLRLSPVTESVERVSYQRV